MMPKESINENGNGSSRVEVRWGGIQQGYVMVGVDRDDPFVFLSDLDKDGQPEYTGLYIFLNSEEDVDALIKSLRKAKRKTFKS